MVTSSSTTNFINMFKQVRFTIQEKRDINRGQPVIGIFLSNIWCGIVFWSQMLWILDTQSTNIRLVRIRVRIRAKARISLRLGLGLGLGLLVIVYHENMAVLRELQEVLSLFIVFHPQTKTGRMY